MNNPPATMFASYEQDFHEIIKSIGTKLGENLVAEGIGEQFSRDE
jgi:hypothetical protein